MAEWCSSNHRRASPGGKLQDSIGFRSQVSTDIGPNMTDTVRFKLLQEVRVPLLRRSATDKTLR
jgi:hypothetical protein